MKLNNNIGIVACSNGLPASYLENIENLVELLKEMGFELHISPYIYSINNGISASPKDKADVLMNFYLDSKIDIIMDVSGGDLTNTILPYIDFSIIQANPKMFIGYSDLTVLINTIYSATNQSSMFYNINNLVDEYESTQTNNFKLSLLENKNDLFDIKYHFIQGNELEGIVVGGNMRCLLKLAGTSYWPNFKDRVLLLESLGGRVPQMMTYLTQLKMLGVFDDIKGILLGTFIEMERENSIPSMEEIILEYAGDLPVVKTNEIGHRNDSKAIMIGDTISLKKM